MHGICMIYLFCDLCYHYKAVRVCRVMCHHPSKTWQGHFKSCLPVFLRSKYHAEAQRHRKTPANEPLAWLIGVHDILTFFTFHHSYICFYNWQLWFPKLATIFGVAIVSSSRGRGGKMLDLDQVKGSYISAPFQYMFELYKQNIKNKG